MPRGRRSYPLEFRRRIVELVRVGRRPGELAREFEPTVESINRWVKQADRDEGRLADGFGYVSSSLDAEQVTETGRQVRFTLQGDDTFTYTVTASRSSGSHSFSGTLIDFDKVDYTVGGASSVTVKSSSGGLAARASRSFDNPSVAQDGEVVVTIDVANYGQAGGVTETLPSGFTYVSSSLDTEQVTVTGQEVRFTLQQGDTTFTYTVTASMTAGSYEFEGSLRDFDKNDTQVVGDDTVTVGHYAARSFSRASVTPGSAVV